jgi:phage virion morphogenesis protein
MFKKLRTTRFLKFEANERSFAIGFAGRVARLARIHQFGEKSRVAPDGPEYRYPMRALLGFTNAEREMIRDRLLTHLK